MSPRFLFRRRQISAIFVKCKQAVMRWLQLRFLLRFNFDSSAIRLLVKGHCVHNDVIRHSCSHADLFLFRPLWSSPHRVRPTSGHSAVELQSNGSRTAVESQLNRSFNRRLATEGSDAEKVDVRPERRRCKWQRQREYAVYRCEDFRRCFGWQRRRMSAVCPSPLKWTSPQRTRRPHAYCTAPGAAPERSDLKQTVYRINVKKLASLKECWVISVWAMFIFLPIFSDPNFKKNVRQTALWNKFVLISPYPLKFWIKKYFKLSIYFT